MLSAKERAVAPTTAPQNMLRAKLYRRRALKSSTILKDQIGLLLLALQRPLTRKQHNAGYQLLQALVVQRWSAPGEIR